MPLRFLVAYIFLVTPSLLFAQSKDSVQQQVRLPILAKYSPLSLLDPDPTIQFGLEYPLSNLVSIQLQVGALKTFGRPDFWGNNSSRMIYRVRPEVRVYLNKERDSFDGAYLALEGLFKEVRQQRAEEINQGSYFEYKEFLLVRQAWGSHIKFGFQKTFTRNKKWLFDFYFGPGLRWVFHHTTNDVSLDQVETEDIFWGLRNNEARPSFAWNIQVCKVLGGIPPKK